MERQCSTEVEIKIEGSLSSQSVAVLQEEAERWQHPQRVLVLNMAGVRSIDETGIALLRDWADRGPLRLQQTSRSVSALLESHGLRTTDNIGARKEGDQS